MSTVLSRGTPCEGGDCKGIEGEAYYVTPASWPQETFSKDRSGQMSTSGKKA